MEEQFQDEKTIADLLGLSPIEAEETRKFTQDYPSAVSVPAAPNKIFVTFLSNQIEVVEKEKEIETRELINGILQTKKITAMVKMPFLKVKDDLNIQLTLWCTAKSLKREVMKLFYKFHSLEGLRIAIWTEVYQHKTYGETKAFRIQVIPKDA